MYLNVYIKSLKKYSKVIYYNIVKNKNKYNFLQIHSTTYDI